MKGVKITIELDKYEELMKQASEAEYWKRLYKGKDRANELYSNIMKEGK